MRHLRNTLYVLSEDAYLTLDGENIVAKQAGKEMGRVPLHTLEAIFCFSYMGATPALMGACGERGIGPVSYTHLDVYKRQVEWLRHRLGGRAGGMDASRLREL